MLKDSKVYQTPEVKIIEFQFENSIAESGASLFEELDFGN